MTKNVALCIHGHFYQPPRHDPITGEIPNEPGAEPYHNWNERIHAECYEPNARLGNFERISFDIGPTLFTWMETYAPHTVQAIISQDRANVERFGVGNAMAQAYNHTILPLAAYTDKVTQVRWGIAEFEHRFGRKPEGMWLPETAVDTETLCVLADHGITFTILAPWQAQDPHLDTGRVYRVPLPHGRSINVFFYHPSLSSMVSFDPTATANADEFFATRVRPLLEQPTPDGEPRLVLLASDGELYGHHQPFRDYFLQYLLTATAPAHGVDVTYPARWIGQHPPRATMHIRDHTSWSCHHGVLRWSGMCPCTPDGGAWKEAFRDAMNRIGAALDGVYIEHVQPYIANVWELRHRYIEVILGYRAAEDLVWEMAGKRLDADITQAILLLLKSQHARQQMFTSCGWFFEDFDRIEPKNNVAYVAQAVWFAQQATHRALAPGAAARLRAVMSTRTGLRGDTVFWQQWARWEEITNAYVRHHLR